MDDSELDFVDVASKLLKRVRKKAADPGRQSRKAEQQNQATRGGKRNFAKQDEASGSRSASQPAEPEMVCGGTGCRSEDAAAEPPADGDLRAKDKVLLRMQGFKRASPQRIKHSSKTDPPSQDGRIQAAGHQEAGRKVQTYSCLFNCLFLC